MLLPGCSASNSMSESPVSGPLFIHLKSLQIFISTKDKFFKALDNSAALSCELMPWKKLDIGLTLKPDPFSTASQKLLAKSR